MISVLLQILIAVLIVSLVSLVGIFIFFNKKLLHKALFFLVSFAAGSLLGAAFLDLLPEAIGSGYKETISLSILIGILSFFAVEKFFYWHHHHTGHEKEEVHAFTHLNIFGDAIHNFIDGAVIATSFLQNTQLGVVTTIAVIAHEIPQEIGDFAILTYGGFSKMKALAYNFLTALIAILGALMAYYYSGIIQSFATFLTAFAVGGFIYIASTDLIPELQKEKNLKKSFLQFLFLVSGVLVIWFAGNYFE